MIHRQNNILKTATDGTPAFAASYTVTVYEAGAIASEAAVLTSVAVDEGHSFAAYDNVLVWNGTAGTFIAEGLSSVTDTSLTWASAKPTIVKGDVLVNLGNDTAAGSTPNYDGSAYPIYTDADGSDRITSSVVTSSVTGNYDYYSYGWQEHWEVVRDSGGTLATVIKGWSGQTAHIVMAATLGTAPSRAEYKMLTTFPNELYVSEETSDGVWEWVSIV